MRGKAQGKIKGREPCPTDRTPFRRTWATESAGSRGGRREELVEDGLHRPVAPVRHRDRGREKKENETYIQFNEHKITCNETYIKINEHKSSLTKHTSHLMNKTYVLTTNT